MINNYVKVGLAVVRSKPEEPGNQDRQRVVFFDDRDAQQVVEVNRVTRGRPRSVYRAVPGGPLGDVHVVGQKREEV